MNTLSRDSKIVHIMADVSSKKRVDASDRARAEE